MKTTVMILTMALLGAGTATQPRDPMHDNTCMLSADTPTDHARARA